MGKIIYLKIAEESGILVTTFSHNGSFECHTQYLPTGFPRFFSGRNQTLRLPPAKIPAKLTEKFLRRKKLAKTCFHPTPIRPSTNRPPSCNFGRYLQKKKKDFKVEPLLTQVSLVHKQ